MTILKETDFTVIIGNQPFHSAQCYLHPRLGLDKIEIAL